MFADLEYRFLRWAYPKDPNHLSGEVYRHSSKLAVLLGGNIFERVKGQVVVDFGCGYGEHTIELARAGAKQAIGLDIRDEVLRAAMARAADVPNIAFRQPGENLRGLADIVISLDSFEHFSDPEAILSAMYDLLKPGGMVLASFGPPWLHPLGGHAFSVFPWSHLVLDESALCRWYTDVKQQYVARFEDVSGGLNRMTIARFERLVSQAGFSQTSVTPVPIRKLSRLHNRTTREFTTSVVRCELKK